MLVTDGLIDDSLSGERRAPSGTPSRWSRQAAIRSSLDSDDNAFDRVALGDESGAALITLDARRKSHGKDMHTRPAAPGDRICSQPSHRP